MTPFISVPPEPTGSTGAAPQLFCDQGQVTSLSLLISVLSLIIKCISLAKDLGSFRKAQKASKDD